ECLKVMQKTHAYAFYLSANEIENPIEIDNDIYAWQFHYGKHPWNNNFNMTIYQKSDIYNKLRGFNFRNINELTQQWARTPINESDICLFFASAKIVKNEG
ncbi:unnamed protein product, partial [marine sediment metagenome]